MQLKNIFIHQSIANHILPFDQYLLTIMESFEKEIAQLCACCGNNVGQMHVNLTYTEQRISRMPDDLEDLVEVLSGVVLKSYCMNCQADAAIEELSALGINLRAVSGQQTNAQSSVCCICGKAHIDLQHWHGAYTITVDEFDGESCNVLQTPVALVACVNVGAAQGSCCAAPQGAHEHWKADQRA